MEYAVPVQRLKNARSVKLAMPVEGSNGLNVSLSQHFGRAPYFAVVELDENGKLSDLQLVPNKNEHFGGMGKPPMMAWSLFTPVMCCA